MAATVLLRLAALTGEDRYRAAAERAIGTLGPLLERHPTAFAQWLCALAVAHRAFHGGRDRRRAGVGDAAGARRRRSIAATTRSASRRRRPTPATSSVPLLHDRFALDGRPTAFVCHGFACRLPGHRARGPRGAPCRNLRRAPPVVVPRPAATVVLVRPGPRGPEVLLTRRPSTMAFGPGLHVFPGGALDPSDAAAGGRPVRRAPRSGSWREEVGIDVAAGRPGPACRDGSRRPAARAGTTRASSSPTCPTGRRSCADPREVADHRWMTPRDALAEMAAGDDRPVAADEHDAASSWRRRATSTTSAAISRPLAPAADPVARARVAVHRPAHVRGAGAIPGQSVDA